ncbi:myosin-binding protein 3-like isoform X1 [Typha angustifolia]|uniref:myosin-binding protein 3-like isoform X1 n=1 Tax=Typha angustifolia TaxID=59011 RepID=UPI003C2CF566
MGANKFATMLHRNTHRMAVILVYTVLEWILIALLLLNGLFSYLIYKFASFFGLKPPCVFCSRVDHLFEPDEGRRGYRNLLCDAHAVEVSKLGYCSNHRRLAEAGDMCEDCSSSRPAGSDRAVAVLSWMKRSEMGEKDLRCSCCRVALESEFYSPYFLLKPSWGSLDYTQKGSLVDDYEGLETDVIFEVEEGKMVSLSLDCAVMDHEEDAAKDEETVKDEDEQEEHLLIEFSDTHSLVEDDALEVMAWRGLESTADEDRVLPLELIDSMTMMVIPDSRKLGGEDDEEFDHEKRAVLDTRSLDIGVILEEKMVLASDVERADIVGENSSVPVAGKTMMDCPIDHEPIVPLVTPTSFEDGIDRELGAPEAEQEFTVRQASEEDKTLTEVKANCEILIRSEIHEQEEVLAEENCSALLAQETTMDGSTNHETVVSSAAPVILEGNVGSAKDAAAAEEELAGLQDLGEVNKLTGVKSICEISTRGEIFDQEKVLTSEAERIDVVEENYSLSLDQEAMVECSTDHETVVPTVTLMSHEDSADAEVDIPAAEEGPQDGDTNCEISIGSEICEQEQGDEAQFQEPIPPSLDVEAQFTENFNETTDTDLAAFEPKPVVTMLQSLDSLSPTHHDTEEERPPETPTYVDGIHGLHKRYIFDRRESGVESLDGSVSSEVESSEPLTIDQLKSALKSERKALSALYAELEEERSAAAIAANQTMAMITRLQEEKAAMQMEALQYQRMMDEQSEYDQEALHLMNELMVKREKEKQVLEKELDAYRQKVLLYEAKGRRRMARVKANNRNESSSASSSAEDSDDLSLDYCEHDEYGYNLKGSNQNTPTDAVLSSGTDQETARHLVTLDESLADFEEERLSILEQLKTLEEKLFTMEDEDSDNGKLTEQLSEENHHGLKDDYESLVDVLHETANGFSDDLHNNHKLHYEGRNSNLRGKRLLPLFDAINSENEDGLAMNQEAEKADGSPRSISKLAKDQEKLAIAEEVDNVYERLQALEADREFLKHCVKSLKQGDKGLDLLQEILQHLRDLRSVELRVKSAGDAIASLSA